MRVRRSPWFLALAAVSAAGLSGCGKQDGAGARDSSATSADSAAPGAAPTSTASGPTRVEGFQNPESVKYDAELDVWYVSNVNGSPTDKDGNGYISRLKADGSIDSLKFIVAGAKGAKLDAPKGMALQGDTLWVADITSVRGFNRKTGAMVADVAVKGSKFLNDVALGEDGLYVTDTGVQGGASGLQHTGPDRIYRIGPKHAVSIAIQNDSLAGANGIAWDSAGHRFIVVPFIGKTIVAWTPGSKTVTPLGASKGSLDGVELLEGGRLVLTSWADSSLDVFDNGRLTAVSTDLPSPADIGIDAGRNRIAIPLLMENRIEFRSLPPSGKEGA